MSFGQKSLMLGASMEEVMNGTAMYYVIRNQVSVYSARELTDMKTSLRTWSGNNNPIAVITRRWKFY
jgi:hypothetical protein